MCFGARYLPCRAQMDRQQDRTAMCIFIMCIFIIGTPTCICSYNYLASDAAECPSWSGLSTRQACSLHCTLAYTPMHMQRSIVPVVSRDGNDFISVGLLLGGTPSRSPAGLSSVYGREMLLNLTRCRRRVVAVERAMFLGCVSSLGRLSFTLHCGVKRDGTIWNI